jgi:hypothetical protein
MFYQALNEPFDSSKLRTPLFGVTARLGPSRSFSFDEISPQGIGEALFLVWRLGLLRRFFVGGPLIICLIRHR